MANYITPTDPFSQRTRRTVGVHTTHAWPIYIYRPIDEQHGGNVGGILKTAVGYTCTVNTAEGNTKEQNKRS